MVVNCVFENFRLLVAFKIIVIMIFDIIVQLEHW